MSIDVLAVIELASVVAGKQPIATTLSDVQTLYGVYQALQARTFDAAAMSKANTLEPAIAALTRSAALLDGLLKDPAQAPRVVSLFQSITH